MIYRFLDFVAKLPKPILLFSSTLSMFIICFVDYYIGTNKSLAIFYTFPIAAVAWSLGKNWGLIYASLGAVLSIISEFKISSQIDVFTYIWNFITKLGFYFILAQLLHDLKLVLDKEKNYANTDFLTGALSRRSFYIYLKNEFNRLPRYQDAFTLAYIDLDNFKAINDNFGHNIGDIVLKSVVETIFLHTRNTDYICRLGGDEFALILPNTSLNAAQVVISKLHDILLEIMQKNNWLITFSIGSVTFYASPETIDQAINLADGLMYSVKKNGKNAIKYLAYPYNI